jgi:hypothetical protein
MRKPITLLAVVACPPVNYLDVRLKLDVEPNVYLDIKMQLEVSNILGGGLHYVWHCRR